LFGVLVPLCAGAATVRSCAPFPDSIADAVQRHGVNTLCSVPPHLAGVVSLTPQVLSSVRRVFCSAGRLDAELKSALVARFSFELTEVFGSSETGGIACRGTESARWTPLACVRVAVAGDGALLVDSPFLEPTAERPLRCADLIELHADGSFTHLGRSDSIIKIGGERVSVLDVEDRIRRIDGVHDVAVVPMSCRDSRQWELWALVASTSLDAGRFRQSLTSVLEPVAIPRRLKIVPRLPREASGKLPRSRLLRLFEEPET
jgi:acyl-coenzyme A synthetase/AMP-(fatty) acid ligase